MSIFLTLTILLSKLCVVAATHGFIYEFDLDVQEVTAHIAALQATVKQQHQIIEVH